MGKILIILAVLMAMGSVLSLDFSSAPKPHCHADGCHIH